MKNYYINIVQEMLSCALNGNDTKSFRRQLYYIRAEKLNNSLVTDSLKIAFWLNLYTVFHIIREKSCQKEILNYKTKNIKIARNVISFSDIEHGILRKTKLNFGFGYITNPFFSSFIKEMAVNQLDYKIHFALDNIKSTVKSAVIYDPTTLDEQLNDITKTILNLQTHEQKEKRILISPTYLGKYAADFGGLKRIKTILQHYLDKDLENYILKFKKL